MTVATAVTFAAQTPEELAELYRRLRAMPEQDPPNAERIRLIDRIAASPRHLFRELAALA